MNTVLDEAHSQVLVDRQVRKDGAALRHVAQAGPRAPERNLLADVHAAEADGPFGQRNLADQRLEQRRLAHAVVAEDADDLVIADGEIDAGEHRNAAIPGVQS